MRLGAPTELVQPFRSRGAQGLGSEKFGPEFRVMPWQKSPLDWGSAATLAGLRGLSGNRCVIVSFHWSWLRPMNFATPLFERTSLVEGTFAIGSRMTP
jgi:hypothetical protein